MLDLTGRIANGFRNQTAADLAEVNAALETHRHTQRLLGEEIARLEARRDELLKAAESRFEGRTSADAECRPDPAINRLLTDMARRLDPRRGYCADGEDRNPLDQPPGFVDNDHEGLG